MSFRNSSTTNASVCPTGLRDVDIKAIVGMNSFSSFFSISGNLLVLTAIYNTASLRTVTNFFVASLAFADLMVGVFVGPLYTARAVLRAWDSTLPICVATEIMSTVPLEATLLNLCAVSIDRFLAITDALHYPEIMTRKRCLFLIAFCWASGAALALVRLIITDTTQLPLFYGIVVGACVVFPFGIITYCYIRIFKVARMQSKRIESITVATVEQRLTTKRNNKAAWTIAIIIGLFVVFWTPVTGIALFQMMVTDPCLASIIYIQWFWGVAFACYNSVCNPWVFALRHRGFKEAYVKTLGSLLPGHFKLTTRRRPKLPRLSTKCHITDV